jgi:hypothetical protein
LPFSDQAKGTTGFHESLLIFDDKPVHDPGHPEWRPGSAHLDFTAARSSRAEIVIGAEHGRSARPLASSDAFPFEAGGAGHGQQSHQARSGKVGMLETERLAGHPAIRLDHVGHRITAKVNVPALSLNPPCPCDAPKSTRCAES